MPKKPQKKAEQSAFFCMQKREKHNGIGKRNEILRIVKRRLKLQQPPKIVTKSAQKPAQKGARGGASPPLEGGRAQRARPPFGRPSFFFFGVGLRPLAPPSSLSPLARLVPPIASLAPLRVADAASGLQRGARRWSLRRPATALRVCTAKQSSNEHARRA